MEQYDTVEAALSFIQQNLKAPKGRTNTFGNYKYRAQEDILEAVKPLLKNAVLRVYDDIVEIGGRVYVKACATISVGGVSLNNTAFAREPEIKKGMDESQITGAASSYARKYALNGLFLIDDTQDADATNDHGNETKSLAPVNKTGNRAVDKWVNNAIADLQAQTNLDDLKMLWADFVIDAKKKGVTKEQMDLMTDAKDMTKQGLMIKDAERRFKADPADDIPDFAEQ